MSKRTFEEELAELIARHSGTVEEKAEIALKLTEVAAATEFDARTALRAKAGLEGLAAIEKELADAKARG